MRDLRIRLSNTTVIEALRIPASHADKCCLRQQWNNTAVSVADHLILLCQLEPWS